MLKPVPKFTDRPLANKTWKPCRMPPGLLRRGQAKSCLVDRAVFGLTERAGRRRSMMRPQRHSDAGRHADGHRQGSRAEHAIARARHYIVSAWQQAEECEEALTIRYARTERTGLGARINWQQITTITMSGRIWRLRNMAAGLLLLSGANSSIAVMATL